MHEARLSFDSGVLCLHVTLITSVVDASDVDTYWFCYADVSLLAEPATVYLPHHLLLDCFLGIYEMLDMTCCKMNPDLVPFETTRAEIMLHAADPVLMATFYKI